MRYGGRPPFVDTVVALLLPLMAGAAADITALVATAGLFVRPLAAELSSPGCNDGTAAVGAVAGGGCGTPTDSDAGGCCAIDDNMLLLLLLLLPLLVVPFVIADGLPMGDEISGVEIECGDVIDATDDDVNPFANVVNG